MVCGSVITADQGRGGVVVLVRTAYPPALLHHVFAEHQVGDLVLIGAARVDGRAVTGAQVKAVEEVAVGEQHVHRAVGKALVAEAAGGRARVRAEPQFAGLQVAQRIPREVRPGEQGLAGEIGRASCRERV